MTTTIRVTDNTTRAELITLLVGANNAAKATRRKGYIGVASATYTREHQYINVLLDDLQRAP